MIAVLQTMMDELRRAFRMTFHPDAWKGAKSGAPFARSNLGWALDPHLRRAYLFALPVALVGAVVAIAFEKRPLIRNSAVLPFLAMELPFALASALLWLYLAAKFRRAAEKESRDL